MFVKQAILGFVIASVMAGVAVGAPVPDLLDVSELIGISQH
jgi:hypothetical protein